METPQTKFTPNLEIAEDNLERGDTVQIEDGITDTHPKETILSGIIDDQIDAQTLSIRPKDSIRCLSVVQPLKNQSNVAISNNESNETTQIDRFSVNIKRDNSQIVEGDCNTRLLIKRDSDSVKSPE